jgi:hypothetical protein
MAAVSEGKYVFAIRFASTCNGYSIAAVYLILLFLEHSIYIHKFSYFNHRAIGLLNISTWSLALGRRK